MPITATIRKLARLFSDDRYVLRFDGGTLTVENGNVTSRLQREVASILRETGSGAAEIRIAGDGQTRFSSGVPAAAEQRLRNVLHALTGV